MNTPCTGKNPSCVVWWLWQETGRHGSCKLVFAERLVCSKIDLRQVENETAFKNDVAGLSFLLCNRTQKHNLQTGPGWSTEHFVFHITQQNFHVTCKEAGVCSIFHILQSFSYGKLESKSRSWPRLWLQNQFSSISKYFPIMDLPMGVRWTSVSSQARVCMWPISFSCGVSLSRTDLQPPLPKNTKISKIFNILSSFVSYSFIYQIQTFFCYIMDSVLVIIKSRQCIALHYYNVRDKSNYQKLTGLKAVTTAGVV